jgi:signal transduction histidine kinase
VRRWLPSSADPARWRWALAWLAAAAFGVAAEWVGAGWDRPRDWVFDLLTGWSLIACGLLATSRRPASWSGALLVITGGAWFVPNFAASGVAGVGWVGAHALYLHRGPLVALLLSYPGLRMRDLTQRAAVFAGVVLAFTSALWRSEIGSLCAAAGMVAFVLVAYLVAGGEARRLRLAALALTVPVACGLATIAAMRLARDTHGSLVATLRGYEVLLVAVAVAAAAGIFRAPWEQRGLTDSVVELGEARSATLRDALASALGDRSMQIGYWSAPEAQFVDVDGGVVPLPANGSDRGVTIIGDAARPVAVLIHDPVFRADRALLDAVASAARLAARHSALQREAHARVVEVAESRRRVVEAVGDERRRLEQRLHDGAQHRLEGLAETLRRAAGSSGSEQTRRRVGRAVAQLARVRDELGRLARGIHPRELEEAGLEAALRSMAAGAALPVELSVSAPVIDPDVAACAYFVCAEALANVVKHAQAAQVRISVRSWDGETVVTVDDNGTGGADTAHGTGLRGLADRVDTLGGQLSVHSPPGGGTQVVATLPHSVLRR